MSKEFIQKKKNSESLTKAVRQYKQLSYLTTSKIADDFDIQYFKDYILRNHYTDDLFLNWVKGLLKEANFLSFVKYVWPEFIEGSHHKIINKKFNDLANGKIKRLIINMPPRHTKSEFASYLLPAWMVGLDPRLKIIQATHTADLAIDFGRKTKNLVDQENYKQLFDTRLMEDSQAAGKWKTEQGGEYFAAGVGGAITGRGADLLIIDDPPKEQDIKKIVSH